MAAKMPRQQEQRFLTVDKVLWLIQGKGIRTCGVIPKDLELFQDHFPKFPVLPGVLSLELLKISADIYLRELDPEVRDVTIKKIEQVKFAKFLGPGDPWEGELTIVSQKDRETQWTGFLFHHGKRAVTASWALEIVK